MSFYYKVSKKSGEITKLPDIPGGKVCIQGSAVFGKYIYLFGGYK